MISKNDVKPLAVGSLDVRWCVSTIALPVLHRGSTQDEIPLFILLSANCEV